MKKFLSLKSYLILIIILCITSVGVYGTQYTICSAGCDFTTITAGLENITGTDNTLNINKSGTYTNTNITSFYVSLSATEPVILITAEDVVLDCSGADIIGNTTGYGISAIKNNVTIQNCWVENYTRGIIVQDSSDGNIISNIITSCSYGLWISNTNTTTITGNSLISSDVAAIEFTNTAINNTVLNTGISGSVLDIRSGGTDTTNFIINSSFDSAKLSINDAEAEVIIGWFYKVYVNDSSGSPVNNTIVNVTNVFSELEDSLTTDETGYTTEQPIPEYMLNSTGITQYVNYTIYAYNSTSFAGRSVNISSSQTVAVTFDTTAPVISSITVTTTNNSALIAWATDDMSNATFEYGITAGSLNLTSNSGTFAQAFSINITGLASNATYYYNITSCNDQSLCKENGTYNFTTNVTPDITAPVISSLTNTTTNETVVITFNSDDLSNATVNYGLTTALGTNATNATIATAHYVRITGLAANTTYYYNVTTCNNDILCTEAGAYNFTTNVTIDSTAPVISLVAATTGIYNASISWTTNENSTTVVKFGTVSGNYTNSSSNSSLVTSHAVNITELDEYTLYYYVVNSTDSDGNSLESSERNFTTLDATIPTITFSIINQSTITDWKNIAVTAISSELSVCVVDAYKLGSAISTTDLAMTSIDNITFTRSFNSTSDSVSAGYDSYFTIKCTDLTNNIGTNTVYFRINDTTAPSVAFVSPTPDQDGYSNNRTLIVNLTAGETPYTGYPKIKVDSGSFIAMTSAGNLMYSYTSGALAEGKHDLIISMKDAKGNEINYTKNYTVDITKPEITINSPDGKTLRVCTALDINVSLKEDGICEYELFEEDIKGYDRCIDRCSVNYDRCISDATTTAQRTACTNNKKDCEADCDEERYDSKKTGTLSQEYCLEDCYDECDDEEDDCTDVCKDNKAVCYVSAVTNSQKEDCDDDYTDCLDDCTDTKDDCYDECDDDIEYLYFKDMGTTCLDDASYMMSITCEDLAGNEKIENVSFVMQDTQAPVIVRTEPNGTIDTSTVSIRVYTDEVSSCRFSESDKAYSSMEYVLRESGNAHSLTLNNFADGDYVYYVRCNDTKGNVMASSAVIRFSVKATASVTSSRGTASKTFSSLTASAPGLFEPDDSADIPITSIEISVNENVQNAKISITEKTDTAGIQKPLDAVYKYLTIEKTGITSTQMNSATVKFRVEKSWLAQNMLDPAKVYIARYSSRWNSIETAKISDDVLYNYYQAELTAFSVFAIMSKPAETIPATQTIPKTEETIKPAQDTNQQSKNTSVDQPVEITKESTSTWIWILLLSVVVVGGGLAFLFVYKHRHPQQVLAGSQIQPTRDSVAAAEESVAADPSTAVVHIDSEYEKNIVDYIGQCIDAGMEDWEIKKNLIDAGHDATVVGIIYGRIKTGSVKKNHAETAYEKEVISYIDSYIDSCAEDKESPSVKYERVKKTLLDAGHSKTDIDRIISEYKNKNSIESEGDGVLIDYINGCLDDGISDKRIVKALVNAGHEENYVKVIVERIDKQRKKEKIKK